MIADGLFPTPPERLPFSEHVRYGLASMRPELKYGFEVFHGGELCASGISSSREGAESEASMCEILYRQHGPVSVNFYEA